MVAVKPTPTPQATRLHLDSGDRLSRAEFHRRYSTYPEIKKAELVQGVVYVPSPARLPHHGWPQLIVAGWLALYLSRHPELIGGDNTTVGLDPDSEVQPDLCIFRRDGSGRARITPAGYVEGEPDLVVEVAASSASYDLHDKKAAYEAAGALEYVVWRVYDEALDWFRLTDGRFERVEPDKDGVIESSIFAGLRLNVAALLKGDLAGVLAALGDG